MASKEHKIVRRAEAMGQLDFLSKLLVEQFNLEPVAVDVTNRDPELAEIQRIESINGLLKQLVESSSVKADDFDNSAVVEPEPEPVKKSTKKHGTGR